MGLYVTYDCFELGYGTFNLWRRAIAKAAGMPPLDEMRGFGGQGSWESLPPNPLIVLLHHSDCDGAIAAEHCAALADALQEVLPKLPIAKGRPGEEPDDFMQYITRRFIAGLRRAVDAGDGVEFR